MALSDIKKCAIWPWLADLSSVLTFVFVSSDFEGLWVICSHHLV